MFADQFGVFEVFMEIEILRVFLQLCFSLIDTVTSGILFIG